MIRPKKALEFAESLRSTSGLPRRARWQLYLDVGQDGWWLEEAEHAARHPGHLQAIKAWDEDRKLAHLRPTTEAIHWLSNTNPKLRDWLRTTTTGSMNITNDFCRPLPVLS